MEPLPPNPSTSEQPRVSETDFGFPLIDDSDSAALFDWDDLLEFAAEDDNQNQLILPSSPSAFGSEGLVAEAIGVPSAGDGVDRVRKRDPKLTCENYLAGIVPCACPEMDALLAEEEELRGTGTKRARTVKAAAGGMGAVVSRCQVKGCEVDISELKGYHKRHRVCLKCANASVILIDGEEKRYCQQCGKFHVLSDFDEGKRSCRMKLEIHNNRRRRKITNLKGSTMEENQGSSLMKEIGCAVEPGKAASEILKTKVASHEGLVTSEYVHVANVRSTLGSQDRQSDSPGSDETNMDGIKDRSKYGPSSSNGDTKSVFSSACPTGRISFKLYDWNPAEFPRRLRHQVLKIFSCNLPVVG